MPSGHKTVRISLKARLRQTALARIDAQDMAAGFDAANPNRPAKRLHRTTAGATTSGTAAASGHPATPSGTPASGQLLIDYGIPSMYIKIPV